MNKNIELLQKAISNFTVLQLKYRSASGVISEREIEPLALFFEHNEWKMVAFCRLRGEKRQFLISRVHSIDSTSKGFPPHQFTLENNWRK